MAVHVNQLVSIQGPISADLRADLDVSVREVSWNSIEDASARAVLKIIKRHQHFKENQNIMYMLENKNKNYFVDV